MRPASSDFLAISLLKFPQPRLMMLEPSSSMAQLPKSTSQKTITRPGTTLQLSNPSVPSQSQLPLRRRSSRPARLAQILGEAAAQLIEGIAI